jgi:spore maturation protein CgeB
MRGQLADLVLLNDPVNLDRFREQGPAEYMPHAYRPRVHHPRTGPVNPELAADLTFIGTAFKSRVAFFEEMNLDGLDVLLGGADWGSIPESSPLTRFVGSEPGGPDCVDNEQTAELYRHARTGLNFYRREAEEGWDTRAHAMGPREVEMAACNLPFLRDPRGEGDKVLHMLPRFSSPAEAGEQLRWLLSHPDEREAMARKARTAIADRTFAGNARRLLGLLGDL